MAVPVAEKVRAVVEPLVRARRCSVYDLELSRRGSTQILRVVIERPGGVDSDTCATVSQAVSRALDEADVLPGRYTLEVSSPGLERSLKQPEHFALIVGRDLTVRVKLPGAVLEGLVVDAGDDSFRLSTTDGDVDVSYSDVISARTVFSWGPERKADR